MQQHRMSEAEALANQALAHLQASPLRERVSRLEAEAELALGQARQHGGGARSARTHLAHALALREAAEAADSPWLAEARIGLADCLIDLGERKQAAALLAQAAQAHAAHKELGAQFRAALRAVAQRLAARPA